MNDISADQLLSAFLDACRDGDREAACKAIKKLHYYVEWVGSPLPRDVRPDPEEQAELHRISALWREDRRKQTGAVPTIRKPLTADEYAKIRSDFRAWTQAPARLPLFEERVWPNPEDRE